MIKTLSDYSKGAQKIILAGERLVALHGFDGVSVRAILTSAGQANKSAIQYFFESKEGLIRTIFDLRQAELDDARREWLLGGCGRDADSYDALITAIMQPMLHVFDDVGLEIFARFILQLMASRWDDPIFAQEREPYTTRMINERLRQQCGHLPNDVFQMRYRLAVILFLNGIAQRGLLLRTGRDPYGSIENFWSQMLESIIDLFLQPYHSELVDQAMP